MDKVLELVAKAQAVLQNLKYSVIVKAVVVASVIGIGMLAYENREPFYKQYLSASKVGVGRLPVPISEASQQSVIQLVNRLDIIAGIQMFNANFQKNERVPAYTYSDDYKLKSVFDEFYKTKISPTPLLITVEKDAPEAAKEQALVNNTRMIEIINGQYVCYPFEKTLMARTIPTAKDAVKVLCSVSIPPYFGYFSGYVTMYLSREPVGEEVDVLRSALRMLSSDIYDREFLK